MTKTDPDPLAALTALPGVADHVETVRKAVDQVYRHRVMRRRSSDITSEAVLRGARASAACEGADWPLEEVRRRSDFSAAAEDRVVGAALRVSAEAGQLLNVWRHSPLQALARLHLVAASGIVEAERVGRPRQGDEAVEDPLSGARAVPGAAPAGAPGTAQGSAAPGEMSREVFPEGVVLPSAEECSARLNGLARLLAAKSEAPALVVAAVVHGELLALRPFGSLNGLVARAAERLVLVGSGLDPKSVCPAEVGHAEGGREAYAEALRAYASGTAEGMAAWIAHCAEAVRLGARESMAVCEALQRGAA